ncbi:hypothetical protein [Streptomyces sp. NPDC047972]|uniref:hypothetical protein n=1 Tax=Streptomyces sp. NPDC047972 TaxID=3365493 RepID=UPI00371386AC
MGTTQWIQLGTAVVALLALGASLCNMARSRIKEIEDDYVARYWKILDMLPSDALVNRQPRKTSDEARRAARLYLRLCEDEMELRAMGWVGRHTWREWRSGIRAQLRQWPINGEWERITNGDLKAGTQDQFMELKKLDRNPGHDPCNRNLIVRKWRGL